MLEWPASSSSLQLTSCSLVALSVGGQGYVERQGRVLLSQPYGYVYRKAALCSIYAFSARLRIASPGAKRVSVCSFFPLRAAVGFICSPSCVRGADVDVVVPSPARARSNRAHRGRQVVDGDEAGDVLPPAVANACGDNLCRFCARLHPP